jgi:glyoxylase-like metal-dependent hydrolase (beta-lactamase superfamily II)
MNPLFEAAGLTIFERGWLSSNNMLFAGDDSHGSTLVDSGYCTHAEQTVALVRRVLAGKPLSRVINTHLHSDHCGGNSALQSAFGCSVAVPAAEADKVDAWDEDQLIYRATGQECPRFTRDQVVREGNDEWCGTRRWKVIAAPGHDPESIVLYEPELQLLISADALWENGFGVVFPELEGVAAFDDVRSTLERIEKLPIRWVIPGHGKPFEDAAAAITRANRRLDGFIADPSRHSQHAAKVLIKFHLLAVQQEPLTELLRWINATPYMHLTHGRHAGSTPFSAWCELLLANLCASGAIGIGNGMARNL